MFLKNVLNVLWLLLRDNDCLLELFFTFCLIKYKYSQNNYKVFVNKYF